MGARREVNSGCRTSRRYGDLNERIQTFAGDLISVPRSAKDKFKGAMANLLAVKEQVK